MSTVVRIEMPSEAAARLADPEVLAKLKAALAAEGIPLLAVESPVPKIEPCPKCMSEQITFNNCGYSSFDMATAKCKCGHKIVTAGSDARPDWNAFSDDAQSRRFLHWLLSEEGRQRTVGTHDLVRVAACLFRSEARP